MAFFAVLLGIRLGIPSVVKWFAGTWIWQHSLAGHLRLQLISFGCMLEILGVWGFTIDTKPYYFFRDKGVEPFWGFVERTRQLLFDLGCVIGGGICFLRALSSYHY
jgi:hypothetical protein